MVELDPEPSVAREEASPPVARGVIVQLLLKISGLSGLSMLGQAIFLVALPLLTRLYAPEAIGIFMLYMAALNFAGAVVGLRYETNIVVQANRNDALATLMLAAKLMFVLTTLLTVVAYFSTSGSNNDAALAIQYCIYVLPFGLYSFGLTEAMSYWAVRFGHFGVLGTGRLLHGVVMTSLQVFSGWYGSSPITLVLAHLAAQICYIAFCAYKMLTSEDVRKMREFTNRHLLNIARRDVKTALFIMPAVLITLGISNLPALMIGAVFGAATSAHYGIAYRIIGAPIQLIAWPLTHVASNEIINQKSPDKIINTLLAIVALAVVILSIPLAIVAWFAADAADFFLGAGWRTVGEFVAVMAVAGMVQVIATPLCEMPLLFKRQEFRLLVDVIRGALVFATFGAAIWLKSDALHTVSALAIATAVGFLFSICISIFIVRSSLKAGLLPGGRESSKAAISLEDQIAADGV